MIPIHSLQPYTYIRFIKSESMFNNFRRGDKILFMGWITNSSQDDAVVMDDRGVFTVVIDEEDWEICS